MRLNFAQAKTALAPYVGQGMCASEPAVGEAINEACDRLINSGKWRGEIQRVAICHRAGLFTAPPEVETILAAADCGVPVTVHNQWYSFLPGGPFQMSTCNRWREIEDRGVNWPTQYNITGAMKIRVYSDYAQDDGKAILFQGKNDDGNIVQTLDGSVVVTGEGVILNNAAPPTTTTTWTEITNVQKELTSGYVRIYQVDPDTNENAGLLSVYSPNETIPGYRRYYYGNFTKRCDEDGNLVESYHPLTFLCKIQFVRLVQDNDIVPITASGALRNMCMALWNERNGKLAEASGYEQRAVACLQNELKQNQGAQQHMSSVIPGFGFGPAVRSFR